MVLLVFSSSEKRKEYIFNSHYVLVLAMIIIWYITACILVDACVFCVYIYTDVYSISGCDDDNENVWKNKY